MVRWAFWDWVSYACLGLAALVEAANASLAGAPNMTTAFPALGAGILPYAPLILFVVGSVVLILRAAGALPGRRIKATEARDTTLNAKPKTTPLDASFGEDHDRLVQFITMVLEPACWNLMKLQAQIVDQMDGNSRLKDLAKKGLYDGGDCAKFKAVLNDLSELSCSPPKEATLLELIAAINQLENRAYRNFGMQLQELQKAAQFDAQTYWLTADEWNAWWESHQRLVAEFENIKTSSAYNTRRYGDGMPSLYRPGLESRWGELHDFRYDPN